MVFLHEDLFKISVPIFCKQTQRAYLLVLRALPSFETKTTESDSECRKELKI